jgi:hypothetical protein
MRSRLILILGAALSAATCAETQTAAPPPASAAATPPPAAPTPTPAASPAPASPASAAAPGAGPTESAPSGGPPAPWATMTKDQRKDYMKTVVMPEMKQTFIAFNADRYKSMNCVTCHGDGVSDGKFTMPNPKLPKLPASPAGFQKLMSEKPAIMQFMAMKVKPQMAHLLGMAEFTPESKSGFGCFQCHTKEAQ